MAERRIRPEQVDDVDPEREPFLGSTKASANAQCQEDGAHATVVGGNVAETLKSARAKTGLLEQLALCGVDRAFTWLDGTSWHLDALAVGMDDCGEAFRRRRVDRYGMRLQTRYPLPGGILNGSLGGSLELKNVLPTPPDP
jgi:hypothetical protein